MTHPLTDKVISKQFGRYDGIDDVTVYDEDDIRAAYNLGRAKQLKEVLAWLKFGYQTDPNLSRDRNHRGGFNEIAIALEKAMRPQKEESSNGN